MKRLSIPAWIVGAGCIVIAYFLTMSSSSFTQDIANKAGRQGQMNATGAVRGDLILDLVIWAGVLVVSFILMIMARKHTLKGSAMRVINFVAGLVIVWLAWAQMIAVHNSKLPMVTWPILLVGAILIAFSALSIFFPSKREKAKLEKKKQEEKEAADQQKAEAKAQKEAEKQEAAQQQ